MTRLGLALVLGLGCSSPTSPGVVVDSAVSLPDDTAFVMWREQQETWSGRIGSDGSMLWSFRGAVGWPEASWKSGGVTQHDALMTSTRWLRDAKSTVVVEGVELDTGVRRWQRYLRGRVEDPIGLPGSKSVWFPKLGVGFDVASGAARRAPLASIRYQHQLGSRTYVQTSDGLEVYDGEVQVEHIPGARSSCVIDGDVVFVISGKQTYELTRWGAGDPHNAVTVGLPQQTPYVSACVGYRDVVALVLDDANDKSLLLVDRTGRVDSRLALGQDLTHVVAGSSRFVPVIVDQTLRLVDLEQRAFAWSRPVGNAELFRVGTWWYVDDLDGEHRLIAIDGTTGGVVAVALEGAARVKPSAVSATRVWLYSQEVATRPELAVLDARTLQATKKISSIHASSIEVLR